MHRDELKALQNLCEHGGWRVLERHLAEETEAIKDYITYGCQDMEDTKFHRGVMDGFARIANLPSTLQLLLASEDEPEFNPDDIVPEGE